MVAAERARGSVSRRSNGADRVNSPREQTQQRRRPGEFTSGGAARPRPYLAATLASRSCSGVMIAIDEVSSSERPFVSTAHA